MSELKIKNIFLVNKINLYRLFSNRILQIPKDIDEIEILLGCAFTALTLLSIITIIFIFLLYLITLIIL